jgi:hypothetical protein
MTPAVRGAGRALGLFGAAAGVYVTTFAIVKGVSTCDSWLCRVNATAFLATAFYFFSLGFVVASIIISDHLPRESRKAFWLASLLWLALTAWVLGDTCYRLYRLSVTVDTSVLGTGDRQPIDGRGSPAYQA